MRHLPVVTIIDKILLLRSLVISHFIHNSLFQVICTSTVFTLSSFKHRTRHIDCSTSKKHEVNKNDLIVVNWASFVAKSTISLIVFVLLKEHSVKHSVVRWLFNSFWSSWCRRFPISFDMVQCWNVIFVMLGALAVASISSQLTRFMLMKYKSVRDEDPEISPQNLSRSLSSGSKPSKVSYVKLVSLPNIIPKLQNHSLEPLRSRMSPSKLSLFSSDLLGS